MRYGDGSLKVEKNGRYRYWTLQFYDTAGDIVHYYDHSHHEKVCKEDVCDDTVMG